MSGAYLPGDTRQRIQDLIKDRKITQAELAEKVGLSNSALSRYLQRSTKNLGDGVIIRIAKYFDVSTDFLLGETKDGEAVDLSKMSAEDLTAAVMKTITEAGIAEEKLSSLGISFLDLLNSLKDPDHDE